MNKRLIIGIVGKKSHGKDTIADMIVSRYGYHKISFADPLKEGCRHIFGLADEQLYGSAKDLVDDFWMVTPRELLQYIGTELLRNQLHNIMPHIGNAIWIQRLEKTLINNPDINYVIPDIRFQNELDMLRNHSAIIIKVVRPIIRSDDMHVSEISVDSIKGFDKYVINNGSIESLYNKIHQIMKKL